MGNVVLHAFNWKFAEVEQASKDISQAGFDAVLISPPALSEGKEWFYRYQPLDYRIIQSPLGGLKALTSMIAALKKHRLKVYVDVVFNHMAYRQDNNLDYPGDQLLSKYKHEKIYHDNRLFGDLSQGLFTADDFNPQKIIESADYEDPSKIHDVQYDRISDDRAQQGLPDLNPNSEKVIVAQKEYLKALKALGVQGFRIDAAKHMTIEHIKNVFAKEITQGLFVFGEIIPAHHGKFLDEFVREVNFSAYDFNLFYSIRDALGPEGSLENLVSPRQLDKFKSLSFVVTHDIPNNEAMRMFILDFDDTDRKDEMLVYAYILSRDGGVPLIYSDKGEADGVYSDRWKEAYRDERIHKMIDFHNRMFAKTMEILSAGKCHLIFHREGQGIAAFNKCSDPQKVDINTQDLKGTFTDILSKKSIEIPKGSFSLKLPPRTCQLFLKDRD